MDKAEHIEIAEKLKAFMSKTVPEDKYNEFVHGIDSMTDKQFEDLITYSILKGGIPKDDSDTLSDKLRDSFGISYSDTAAGKNSPQIIPEYFTKAITERLDTTKISDSIKLSESQDKILRNFWRSKNDDNLPADLIFSDTIPLPDCEITVSFASESFQKTMQLSSRVTIFKDWIPMKQGGVIAGVISTELAKRKKLLVPFMIREGNDHINYYNWIGCIEPDGNPSKSATKYLEHLTSASLYEHSAEILTTWYGVQIALLHPVLKEIFSNPKIEARYNPDAAKIKNKKNRRITYNIRTHYIKDGTLEKILHGGKKREYKTLCWYVIGHWRHQNGKQVFVHGYWKGSLRQLRQNLDEGRERIIDESNLS